MINLPNIKNKKKRYLLPRLKSASKKLLLELYNNAKDFLVEIDSGLRSPRSGRFRSTFSTRPRRIYYSYRALVKNQYLEIKSEDKGIVELAITDKGKIAILGWRIQEKIGDKNWDGKWRIITFDIPELQKDDRNFLRRYLHWLGLKELQKSVWVCPHDVEEEFKEFLKLCNREIIGDVRFIVAEKISQENDLIRFFNLQKVYR